MELAGLVKTEIHDLVRNRTGTALVLPPGNASASEPRLSERSAGTGCLLFRRVLAFRRRREAVGLQRRLVPG